MLPLHQSHKAHRFRTGSRPKSKPSARSYIHSPTLLIRPKAAKSRYVKHHPPVPQQRRKADPQKDAEDYDRYMKVRFQAFLANKHATESVPPIDLRAVDTKEPKVSPREDVDTLMSVNEIAAKVQVERAPHAELCSKALLVLQQYMDTHNKLAATVAPTNDILTYVRRCIYSRNPTSNPNNANQIAFVPYFETVATHKKEFATLKSKYEDKTAENNDLKKRIAVLEETAGNLRRQLADNEYVVCISGGGFGRSFILWLCSCIGISRFDGASRPSV